MLILDLHRYMLFHWPLLSAVIGTTLNMCLLSFIALLSWYQIYYSQSNGNSNSLELPETKTKNKTAMEERRRNIREMLAKERKGIYTPRKRSLGGYIGFTLFVCTPSVDMILSKHVRRNGWMDFSENFIFSETLFFL